MSFCLAVLMWLLGSLAIIVFEPRSCTIVGLERLLDAVYTGSRGIDVYLTGAFGPLCIMQFRSRHRLQSNPFLVPHLPDLFQVVRVLSDCLWVRQCTLHLHNFRGEPLLVLYTTWRISSRFLCYLLVTLVLYLRSGTRGFIGGGHFFSLVETWDSHAIYTPVFVLSLPFFGCLHLFCFTVSNFVRPKKVG